MVGGEWWVVERETTSGFIFILDPEPATLNPAPGLPFLLLCRYNQEDA
jgi:hypothetical protein